MRILHVFMDGRTGGPLVRALSVAEGLRDKEIDSVLLLPKGGDFSRLLREREFQCYEIALRGIKRPIDLWGNSLWLLMFPISVFRIMGVIRKEKIDIVHLNGLMALQGGIAAFLCGRKVVWHLSSSLYPRIFVRLAMRLVKKISHTIIIISERVRDFHFSKDMAHDPRVVVVQECVDTVALCRESVDSGAVMGMRRRLGLESGEKVVGMVGNVNPIKGYEDFIEMSNVIARIIPHVKFLVAGAILDTQREYFSSLQALVQQLGLADRMIFTGRIEIVDLQVVLSLLDVFVLTSHAEGGPRVTLEAMSMQTPVITTNVGDVFSQIEDGKEGFIVPVGDWRRIAKIAISLLESQGQAADIGTKARKKVQKEFDVSVLIAKHRQIYDSLSKQEVSRVVPNDQSSD